MVTLFTHPNSHPYDSGLIIADKNGAVEKWLAKEDERHGGIETESTPDCM